MAIQLWVAAAGTLKKSPKALSANGKMFDDQKKKGNKSDSFAIRQDQFEIGKTRSIYQE